ncbi:MAG: arabinan endo-1,5-alpha-L-arabinosidase [Propionibacteriaceae bacterium]|jgi:arabinan endo-1,5-alpha-L-arabinosidase|nr:arabinan endo-1,5-alpha-L-arabinosidase [Propionibacteriaceae bacterium]
MAVASLASCGSASSTPQIIDVSGDIRVHDPALVVSPGDEPWYVYSTGDVKVGFGAPQIRRSTDHGQTWQLVGTAWTAAGDPQWVRESIDGVQNYWAPELYAHDGQWYLYYAASTFGSNKSAIGLATSVSLDPDDSDFGWVDQGQVIASTPGVDNFNAIDPAVISDEDGSGWMFFGSFWGGIFVVPLTWPSGMVTQGAVPMKVASRVGTPNNPIEAADVIRHDQWYYLFVSWDYCCQGADSTYRVMVGRSATVTGPYVDAEGKAMLDGGGTPVLWTDGSMIGPGGASASGDHIGFHYYDGDDGGQFRLAIHTLVWTEDGWPTGMVSSGESG